MKTAGYICCFGRPLSCCLSQSSWDQLCLFHCYQERNRLSESMAVSSLLVLSRVILVWTAVTIALGLLWNGFHYSLFMNLLSIAGVAACLCIVWLTSGKRLRTGSNSQAVVTGFCIIAYIAFAYAIWTKAASSMGQILLVFYTAAFTFTCICKIKNVITARA
jgi:hypothetical protein